MWYWQRARHIDSRNRKQSPGTHPYKYDQFIFDQGAKAIQQRKERCRVLFLFFKQMVLEHPHAKEKKKKEEEKKEPWPKVQGQLTQN